MKENSKPFMYFLPIAQAYAPEMKSSNYFHGSLLCISKYMLIWTFPDLLILKLSSDIL